MKNYALYLLIYNALSPLLYLTDWISGIVRVNLPFYGITKTERYNVIDFYDTPFYILGALIFIYYNFKLSKMQFTYFVTAVLVLVFKWAKLDVGYVMFFVWNYIIIVGIPLLVYFENTKNKTKN